MCQVIFFQVYILVISRRKQQVRIVILFFKTKPPVPDVVYIVLYTYALMESVCALGANLSR
jgi:hypothetical protein